MKSFGIGLITLTGLSVFSMAAAQDETQPEPEAPPQPEPIVSATPVFPAGAQLSGHCESRFDINAEGEPENIEIFNCSDNLYEWSALVAVRKIRYKPEDGGRKGLRTRLEYNLVGEFNQKLPKPKPVDPNAVPDEPVIIRSMGTTRKAKDGRRGENPFCCYEYSVSDTGTPFNVTARKCSSEIDREIFGTGYDLREWRFRAARKDETTISTGGYYDMLWFFNNGQRVYRGSPEERAAICPAL